MSEDQPTAPNEHRSLAGVHGEKRNRTFSLNSDEAYAALCRRSEAWIPNGALPREPRAWDRPVIVEPAGIDVRR
jgi:hypothetical protein